jgi:hypothetical protein
MSRHAANYLKRRLAATIGEGGMNSGNVTIRWREQTGAPGDPELESSQGGEVWAERSEVRKAFIHYVSPGGTGYQRHSEVQTGDVILDFPGAVDLGDIKDATFTVDDSGTVYVRKDAGRELAASWDVRCGGVAICMTLLLRPQAST